MQGNIYYAFVEEEYENMAHQEVNHHTEARVDEEDMDYYCKQFVEFMQTQPQHKFNLGSSKRGQENQSNKKEVLPKILLPHHTKGKVISILTHPRQESLQITREMVLKGTQKRSHLFCPKLPAGREKEQSHKI